jgi:hypothetical protein
MPTLIKTKEDKIAMTTMEVEPCTSVPESNESLDDEKLELVVRTVCRCVGLTFDLCSWM